MDANLFNGATQMQKILLEEYLGNPIKNGTFSILQWIYMLDLLNIIHT